MPSEYPKPPLFVAFNSFSRERSGRFTNHSPPEEPFPQRAIANSSGPRSACAPRSIPRGFRISKSSRQSHVNIAETGGRRKDVRRRNHCRIPRLFERIRRTRVSPFLCSRTPRNKPRKSHRRHAYATGTRTARPHVDPFTRFSARQHRSSAIPGNGQSTNPLHRRTPTIYVSEEQQPESYFRNPDLPHLLNQRAGMISDFRVRDPETARNIAIGLESILFTGAPSGSTTPKSMNSDAIAASVGVNLLVSTPVHRETVPIPTLTEEQTRQAFSVVPPTTGSLNAGRAEIADIRPSCVPR